MTTIERDPTHPSDGDLVRYLDLELLAADAAAVEAHASACGECDRRIHDLREVDAEWSDRLQETEIRVDDIARARALMAVRAAEAARQRRHARDARARSRMLAAAAVVVIVLGSLTVAPVRAWVATRLGLSTPAPSVLVENSSGAAAADLVVSFRITEPVFRIDIEHAQAGGGVVLETTASNMASAEIVDRGDETLLVLPSGLSIENSPESDATYSVRIPRVGVERVAIMAGGRLVTEVAAARFMDAPLTIPLATDRP